MDESPPDPPEWTVDMLEMPPELQSEIFFHLPNLASVVSLRLACRQLNAVYQPHEDKILANLRRLLADPFREYYEFLQRLKFPENSVKYPPPGGWPNIIPENFALYDKTDFAISVLKQFPFIDDHGWPASNETNVGYKSNVIDFSVVSEQDTNRVDLDWPEEILEEDRLNPNYDDEEKITGIRHVTTLVGGHESGGICLLLDTFAGIVFEEEVRGDPRSRLSPRDYCDKRMERLRKMDEIFYGHEETWELNAWDVDEYPQRPAEYDHEQTAADGEPAPRTGCKFHWIAYLYHKFGWPGKDYRKEDCLEAIRDFCDRWQLAEDQIWLQEQAERAQQNH